MWKWRLRKVEDIIYRDYWMQGKSFNQNISFRKEGPKAQRS